MRYVTTALVVAVLILSVQLHSAKNRIAVLEDRSTVYSKQLNTHVDAYKMYIEATDMEGFPELLVQCVADKV